MTVEMFHVKVICRHTDSRKLICTFEKKMGDRYAIQAPGPNDSNPQLLYKVTHNQQTKTNHMLLIETGFEPSQVVFRKMIMPNPMQTFLILSLSEFPENFQLKATKQGNGGIVSAVDMTIDDGGQKRFAS